jgi:hypothetical protein
VPSSPQSAIPVAFFDPIVYISRTCPDPSRAFGQLHEISLSRRWTGDRSSGESALPLIERRTGRSEDVQTVWSKLFEPAVVSTYRHRTIPDLYSGQCMKFQLIATTYGLFRLQLSAPGPDTAKKCKPITSAAHTRIHALALGFPSQGVGTGSLKDYHSPLPITCRLIIVVAAANYRDPDSKDADFATL